MDLAPNHFDTKVNVEMYRWKYAIITDEELLDRLDKEVFKNKHRGPSLEGIIRIAVGEKKKGLQILEKFNEQQNLKFNINDPSENLRRRRAREHAKEIY